MFKFWHLKEHWPVIEVVEEGGSFAVRIGSGSLSFRPGRFGAKRGETVKYAPWSAADRDKLALIARAPAMLMALKAIEALAGTEANVEQLAAALQKAIEHARNATEGLQIRPQEA